MEISDARKLKGLAELDRRLKRLLAEPMLDASTLKEMLGKTLTPGLRRRVVTWVIEETGHSQRQAFRLVGLQPKTYRYASTRPEVHRLNRCGLG